MTQEPERITLAQFKALSVHHSGRAKSPQLVFLRKMECGEAAIIEHGKLSCTLSSGGGCSLTRLVQVVRKEKGWASMSKHLPDGRVAVAFVPREARE